VLTEASGTNWMSCIHACKCSQSLLRQWLLRLAATAAACGGGCCQLQLRSCLQQRRLPIRMGA